MQSGECLPCDPADAWENWSRGSQTGLLIGFIVLGLIVLAFAFFQPLLPALEHTADAAVAAMKALAGNVNAWSSCRGNEQQPGRRDVHKQQSASAKDEVVGKTTPATEHAAHEHDAETAAEAAAAPVFAVDAPPAGGGAENSSTEKQEQQSSGVPHTTSTHLVGHRHKSARLRHQAALEHAGAVHAVVAMGEAATLNAVLNRAISSVVGIDGRDINEEGVGGQLDFLDRMDDLLQRLQRNSKIIVNFYQACAHRPSFSAPFAVLVTLTRPLHTHSSSTAPRRLFLPS
jgi:hypothetical protein